MDIDITRYLTGEEIKEVLINSIHDYAQKICEEYVDVERGYYHGLFSKVIIDYITANYESQFKFATESAVEFIKHDMCRKDYNGENGVFLDKILRFMEEDKERIKNIIIAKLSNSDEELMQKMMTEVIAEFMFNLREKE